MNNNYRINEKGEVNGLLISTIALGILLVGSLIFGIWSYVQYVDQKSAVDAKIEAAKTAAKQEQSDEDDKKFAERAKEPNIEFVGPENYGRVTFDYPKTWSAFDKNNVSSGGKYEAFLNPVIVPPINAKQQYSLRVTIEEKDYDRVIAQYEGLVKKGDLRTSAVTANGQNGTRLDGNFSKDIRGAAVIFRIRDKTLIIQTDADIFKPDFEKLIPTIKFNV